MSKWSEKLKEARALSGLTQQQVGDRIGRPQQTLAGWESGRTEPDLNTLAELLQLYGISANSFFGYNGANIDEEHMIDKYRQAPPLAQKMVNASLSEAISYANKEYRNRQADTRPLDGSYREPIATIKDGKLYPNDESEEERLDREKRESAASMYSNVETLAANPGDATYRELQVDAADAMEEARKKYGDRT